MKTKARFILQCLAVLWVIEMANTLVGHRLSAWGIVPRTIPGLVGIPLSPFLHVSLSHLMVNTMPFAILGGLVMLQGRRVFLEASLWIILIGGAGVWVFGRMAAHVGASGLIFGYFGYLVTRGCSSGQPGAFLIGLLTMVFYGGMLWGIVPTYLSISWEGHLCGLVAGALAARRNGQKARQ